MKKELLKRIALALGIVLFFLGLSYGFVPQVLGGKIVNQSDISGYVGMAHEMNAWNAEHPDDPARWSGSMFSGMPTTAIDSTHEGDWTQPLYRLLLLGKRPATYLFVTLLGAFLLLLALGVNVFVAVFGAVAMAFCSYNMQIIQVGHNTKMQAIAFLPWALAALVFTYRSVLSGKKNAMALGLLGSVLFGLTISLQVKANHQQITYYLALMILLYFFVMLLWVLSRRREALGRFLVASVLLLVLGVAGIATNTNKLLPLYEYTAHTMRGGSELTENQAKSGGLDLEYATAWSYGWEELPNLMIPNYNGGASAGAVNPDKSKTIELLRRSGQGNLKETAKNLPMYWGPQPFTAGPMYMGAVTVFLFVLGLFLYKGKEKWWLLLATVLAVLLGVGSHLMWFTKLCFKILPLYSKFRTVSMALIVLQYTLPMLGFLVLDRFLKGEYKLPQFRRAAVPALLITAGYCLLCWLIPSVVGSFHSPSDAQYPEVLADAFAADRRMLLRSDALLSGLQILLVYVLLRWSYLPKNPDSAQERRLIAVGVAGFVILVNLFVVGKRYLNADDFVTPRNFESQFNARAVDNMILEDKDPSYRVLDMTVNVFNDSHPSYHHKNIGGYSPAKLQRYQDLIERYISPEIASIQGVLRGVSSVQEMEKQWPETPVLNALNNRYLILGEELPPAVNHRAFGPVWWVDSIATAAGPKDEIARIGQVDLRSTAVIADDFRTDRDAALETVANPGASSDRIELVQYSPNELRYRYDSASDRVAVFSEIYYPSGWTATLEDGTAVSLFRTDWTLRGAVLPAGEHELVMRFDPPSYRHGILVSRVSSVVLLLMLLLAIGGIARKP